MLPSQTPWRIYAPRFLALIGVVFVALTLLTPLDYRFFATAARSWRSGASQLYDSNAAQFFYAPWSLILLAPLSFLPDWLGQAFLNLISFMGAAWGVWMLARPISTRALALALTTPSTAVMLILGQWDGLIVGGFALAWFSVMHRRPWLLGLALIVITTKPTNAVFGLLVILYAVRHWPLRTLAITLVAPSLVFAGAFLACGGDWPLRYVRYIQSTPPRGYNVSLSHLIGVGLPLVIALGAIVWFFWSTRYGGVTRDHLVAALVVGLIVSPFVVPYHYVIAAPALAIITHHNWRLGIALWVSASVVFAVFMLGWLALPLALYPLGVCISSMVAYARSRPASPRIPTLPANLPIQPTPLGSEQDRSD